LQNKTISFLEALTNTCLGFLLSLLLVNIVLPLFGFNVKFGQSVEITTIFSIVSIARGYIIRRVFNKKGRLNG